MILHPGTCSAWAWHILSLLCIIRSVKSLDLTISSIAATCFTVLEDTLAVLPVRVSSTAASSTISLNITATVGLLRNDSGSAVDSILLTGTASVLNAALLKLSYEPQSNWNSAVGGFDALQLHATERHNTTNALIGTVDKTIIIEVAAVNDKPAITAPTAVAGDEDVPVHLAGILISDADMLDMQGAAAELTVSVKYGTVQLGAAPGLYMLLDTGGTQRCKGSLTALNAALSALTYTSALQWSGSDTLTVAVNDLGNSGIGAALHAEVQIAVIIAAINDAPVLTLPPSGTVSTREDEAVTITSIKLNDVDAGSSAVLQLTITAEHGTVSLASAGLPVRFYLGDGLNDAAVEVVGTLPTLSALLSAVTFTPSEHSNDRSTRSSAALRFTVSDMGASGAGGQALAAAVLPISVLPVNDAPTVALSAEQLTVAEDTLLSLSGLSVADVDAHEGSGLVELRITVRSGVLLLRSDSRAGLRVLIEQPLQLQFQGTVAAVNAAFAGLSYRSAADWSGLDTLTVTVSDVGNSGAGGAQSAELSAPITVTAVNDAPSIALPAAALTVHEDGQLSLSELSVSDVDLGSNRCTISLAVEHGLLRVEASTAAAAVAAVVYAKGGGSSATAQLVFSAALTQLNAVLSQVVYTPDADWYVISHHNCSIILVKSASVAFL
jgi:Bacterial Ig domain/Bacterial cadherin-like domain